MSSRRVGIFLLPPPRIIKTKEAERGSTLFVCYNILTE